MYTTQTPNSRTAASLQASVSAESWQLATQTSMLRLTGMSPYRPTRREFLIGAAGLLVLAPYGCGSGESGGSGETTAGGTRTVEHAFGTTQVPANPQRIAVVGRRGLFAILLDLGFEPIAALDGSFYFGQPFHPLVADRAQELDVEPIEPADAGPNIEQVAALDPDLIIGASADFEQVASQLAQIAPTVGIEWDFVDPTTNVQAVGDVMGVGDEAAAQVEAFWADVDTVAADLPDPDTVSLSQAVSTEEMRIYTGNNLVGQLVEDFGGQVVPEELPPDPLRPGLFTHVSFERVNLLSGDWLVFLVNTASEEAGGQEAYREALDNPLFQRLPAVQAGQVLEVDTQLVFGTAGLTGMREVLSQLETFFSTTGGTTS